MQSKDPRHSTFRLSSVLVATVALAAAVSTPGCEPTGEGTPAARSAPDGDSYRVAVARFSHETCTFCPGGDPGIEDWTHSGPPHQGDEVLGASAYVRGFAHQAREFGDIEMIGLSSPRGVFGGTSRSWNQEEAFDHFVGQMIEELREAMPVDGVYLSLHGAMAVRNIARPEAEMARRFREVVGPDVPIVGTFDLHGNEDEEFLRWADGSFVTKRFPHYDAWRQGERAARYLRSVMRGTYTPTTAVRRPPILTGTVLQWTGQSPLMNVMERARRWEDREAGAFVNVFLGFPWSDVPTLGTSIHVMTNGDQELADEIADDMAEFIWRVRSDWASGEFPGPREAVNRARAAIVAGETPVVLADYWDRPGDATWTLAELIDQGVGRILYATLTDEPALNRIWEEDMQPGDPFDMEVGGYTGEQAGEPVRITGTLAWRGSRWSYDRVAVIEFGDDSMLILAPAYQQNTTTGTLRFGPVEPDDFDVFVLKTRVHFRRGFDETGYAPTIIIVDAPGDWFGTVRLEALEYENALVDDFYPFGSPAGWSDEAPDRWGGGGGAGSR
jgi:microcystin degradation protein MlrC